jgi:4a-hydroxytetrahydrobiopterin dehydratase
MSTYTTNIEPVLDEAEVRARLQAELPHWFHESEHIQRRFKTGGWRASLLVVNAIGHLAEAAWHHPEIELSYGHVLVKLQTHSAHGITSKDFELARKIEELISWQPGADSHSTLDGIPDDDRYTYIKYD